MLKSRAFHPTRTARNHLRMMAAPCAIPDRRVDEVLDVVGLSSVARKGPRSYSLGRSQRLGLAVALLGASHDEPRGHRALRTHLTLGAVRPTPDNVQRQGSSRRSTQLGRMMEKRSACPKKVDLFGRRTAAGAGSPRLQPKTPKTSARSASGRANRTSANLISPTSGNGKQNRPSCRRTARPGPPWRAA